jgi:hypothetical protein
MIGGSFGSPFFIGGSVRSMRGRKLYWRLMTRWTSSRNRQHSWWPQRRPSAASNRPSSVTLASLFFFSLSERRFSSTPGFFATASDRVISINSPSPSPETALEEPSLSFRGPKPPARSRSLAGHYSFRCVDQLVQAQAGSILRGQHTPHANSAQAD